MDLYHDDLILAAGRVALRKMGCFQLNPYQHAFLQQGLNKTHVSEDGPPGVLGQAMEYAAAITATMFDKSCRLRDLTERQTGRNQVEAEIGRASCRERVLMSV